MSFEMRYHRTLPVVAITEANGQGLSIEHLPATKRFMIHLEGEGGHATVTIDEDRLTELASWLRGRVSNTRRIEVDLDDIERSLRRHEKDPR
jgi:glucokinase